MSPPIRDGSGSSIGSIRLGDGSEISEVRTGAGDVLFSAIPDTAVAQYDATQAPSTGSISSITDQINNHDLSGSASVLSSGINGKQTFRFDGSERMDSPSPSLSRDLAVALVFQIQESPSNIKMIHGSDTDSDIFIQTGAGSGSDYKSRTGTATSGNVGGAVDNNPHLGFHTFPSGGGELEIDGTQVIDYGAGSAGLDGFTLADRSSDDLPIEMDVGEVVLYQSPSTSDIDAERSRLADKWGITI